MAWEKRGNGRYYYYKCREGERVVSRYAGREAIAQGFAELQTLDTRRQQLERAHAQAERAAVDPAAPRLDLLAALVSTLTRAVLEANGYRAHKGQWRKSRMPRSKQPAPPAPLALTTPANQQEAAALLVRLINVKSIDPDAERTIRAVFQKYPTLWHAVGDMAVQARARTIETIAGDQALVRIAMQHGADELERALGYDAAPPLEKLLIEQVVCCSIVANDVQRRYSATHAQSITLTLGEYWEKRLTAAQRRYLRACETLARVRRLAQPTPLQVNIGGQQVNVVGGLPAPLAASLDRSIEAPHS